MSNPTTQQSGSNKPIDHPPMDFDPTTNHALRDELWQRLLARIEKEM